MRNRRTFCAREFLTWFHLKKQLIQLHCFVFSCIWLLSHWFILSSVLKRKTPLKPSLNVISLCFVFVKYPIFHASSLCDVISSVVVVWIHCTCVEWDWSSSDQLAEQIPKQPGCGPGQISIGVLSLLCACARDLVFCSVLALYPLIDNPVCFDFFNFCVFSFLFTSVLVFFA